MEAAGEWSVLIERARAVLHPREISPKPAALRRRFLQRPEMFTSASALIRPVRLECVRSGMLRQT